jgi:hypothetical protein
VRTRLPVAIYRRDTGFDPASIAGLAVWLDASDASTVTVATGVSEWRNKLTGTSISATQGTANNQPLYQIAARNGRNSILFDGTNDVLSLGDLSATFPSGASVVVAMTANDNEYALIHTANNSQFWLFAGATYIGTFKGTRVNAVSSPLMPTASSAIVSVTSDASAYRVYINSTLAHDLAADYSAGTMHRIGNNDLGTFFSGSVHEVLYYSRALTATELQRAANGLRSKWAI